MTTSPSEVSGEGVLWIVSDNMTGEDKAAILEPDDFESPGFDIDAPHTWQWQRPGDVENTFVGTFDDLLDLIKGTVH